VLRERRRSEWSSTCQLRDAANAGDFCPIVVSINGLRLKTDWRLVVGNVAEPMGGNMLKNIRQKLCSGQKNGPNNIQSVCGKPKGVGANHLREDAIVPSGMKIITSTIRPKPVCGQSNIAN